VGKLKQPVLNGGQHAGQLLDQLADLLDGQGNQPQGHDDHGDHETRKDDGYGGQSRHAGTLKQADHPVEQIGDDDTDENRRQKIAQKINQTAPTSSIKPRITRWGSEKCRLSTF
jgi:hypothetical protein